MSADVSQNRNPNLSAPKIDQSQPNVIAKQFGEKWWTGLSPQNCPGFDKTTNTLHALPLVNIDIATREDVLDYFNNSWTLTELLFSSLKAESTYTRSPYHRLRHPLIFYYGHPAVLYLNKLRLAGLIQKPIDLYLEKILETGVDEMSWDDMSKNDMMWPRVEAVWEYRRKVYNEVKEIILTHPSLKDPSPESRGIKSPLWALFMGFEHEKIHFETSSVLIRELPIDLVEIPNFWPKLNFSRNTTGVLKPQIQVDFPKNKFVPFEAQEVLVGKDANAPAYGWDNEYGHRRLNLKAFSATENLISNGEYFEFVSSLAYSEDSYWTEEGKAWRKFRNTKRPTFWVAFGPEGMHEYKLRTIFEIIDMPWDWPVEVNYHEAKAYANWLQKKDMSKFRYRLLTEGEHHALREIGENPVLQKSPGIAKCEKNLNTNSNFISSSPNAVDMNPTNSKKVRDVFGNVWQWLEDQFNPLEGFKVHFLYDDFSTPCFDGKHQMMMGGSFISCGDEASAWARFHFRPHFYQHSGFRISYTNDGSDDNGAVRIIKSESYVHPTRTNILNQMNEANWWKNELSQPLELTSVERKQLWQSTTDSIEQFETKMLERSPRGQVINPLTHSVSADFKVPYQGSIEFPQIGQSIDTLLNLVTNDLAPLGQQPGHPGYFGYVAGGGNSISVAAQSVAMTINQFTAHYNLSPGLVTIENEVIQWITAMVGYTNKDSGGLLTTGGSLANLQALACARNTKLKGNDLSQARFYSSQQVHHCIGKALSFLGFPKECLVLISTDDQFRMITQELRFSIEKDLSQGLQPIAVIGSAGTTNTGAIDPLKEIASIAKNHNIWFHIDGAYGAPFLLTSDGKNKLAGIEESDSVALDPHKAMALPYGTGCLVVKDKLKLRLDYAGESTYMPPGHPNSVDENQFDIADIGPELSRDFRALRLWLPIKHLGIGAFALNLEEKLKLINYLESELKKRKEIVVAQSPQLTILTFRHINTDHTQKLMGLINSKEHIFLTGCQINGVYLIRVCLLGFRVHFSQIETLLNDLDESLKELK
jgi:5-histidylcysteine sulfoxide synthase